MTDKKPNIILITTDQQHWNTIGRLNTEIKTPNLDRLAEEGILFTNAYCTDPTCTPSRASILTGKYPSEHGAWSLGTRLNPEKNTLLTNELKKAGYQTTLIGKAHFEPLRETEESPSLETAQNLNNLDFWREFHGPYYGFDYVELSRGHGNTSEVGQHYAIWLEERIPYWRDYFEKPVGNLPPPPLMIGGIIPQLWHIPEKYHSSRWVEERTIAKLGEFKENNKNFFMWISFPDPHYPNVVPEPWYNMYDPKTITIPFKKRGEHRKSNPMIKITQKWFMKFIVRTITRFQSIIWNIKKKKRRISSGVVNQTDENGLEKFIRRVQKIPGMKKLFPLIKYYTDFIENEKSPYFIHGLHPHVHKKSSAAKSIATLYGKVSLIDDCVGNILAKLEENGQKEDTIIMFTSDHGDLFGQHGLYYKGPFPYDDGMKVPFITRIPKSRKSNKKSDAFLSLIDIAPTILSLAGIKIPKEMTGLDQSDVLRGKTPPFRSPPIRDHIICEMRQSPLEVFMNTFVIDHFKIVFYYKERFGEIFDLKKDPQESKNLWDDPHYEKLKQRLMLDYISKREKNGNFEEYKKIWKNFSIEQLFPVVWEYMLGDPNIMPRIANA